MKLKFVFLAIVSMFIMSNCSKDGDINLFSVKDDIRFGAQLDSTIIADPQTYPILNKAQNAEVYKYVEDIVKLVLQSNEILYRSEFKWQVRVINKNVLNAFAAPGGYIYIYTGFLKYARSEAELAGVIAHEIAHADRRHSTETLTKEYGLKILLSVAIGNNPTQMGQIAGQLAMGGANLSFSRNHEYEADEYSLRYLNSVHATRPYDPKGIVDFFDHMKADSLSQPNGSFEFLRTHPYDDNRIAKINEVWTELGSPDGEKYEAEHSAILAKLPAFQ